ncbi:MAG: hypothetical protein Q4G70_10120 [Pseudomonadota bacterium]|nr:hypothetical protein [Pseudomonadota bacterium]
MTSLRFDDGGYAAMTHADAPHGVPLRVVCHRSCSGGEVIFLLTLSKITTARAIKKSPHIPSSLRRRPQSMERHLDTALTRGHRVDCGLRRNDGMR